MSRYTWLGRDSRDQGRAGDSQIENLASWVEQKWQQGWTKLTVQFVPTRTDKAGRSIQIAGAERPVVAEIASYDGVRTWWAES